MPIKWTPEVDQVLLLKILETSQVNADVKAISETWPENLEKPTPRAITERLVKIREKAKCTGASSHFKVSSGKTGTPGGTPSGTPRKRAKATPKKNGNGVAKVGGSAKKRKRCGNMSEDDISDEQENEFKTEGNDTDASDDETVKAPKKTNGEKRGSNVKLEDSDEEDGNATTDKGDEEMAVGDAENEEAIIYA